MAKLPTLSRFGEEAKLRVDFAAQKPMLYLKISSPDSRGAPKEVGWEESQQPWELQDVSVHISLILFCGEIPS